MMSERQWTLETRLARAKAQMNFKLCKLLSWQANLEAQLEAQLAADDDMAEATEGEIMALDARIRALEIDGPSSRQTASDEVNERGFISIKKIHLLTLCRLGWPRDLAGY